MTFQQFLKGRVFLREQYKTHPMSSFIMDQKTMIAVFAGIILIAGAGYLLISSSSSTPASEPQELSQPSVTRLPPPASPPDQAGSQPSSMDQTQNVGAQPRSVAAEIKNFAFAPKEIRISAGTKVTWTNQDSVAHTVTSDTNAFGSPLIGKGEQFEHVFSQKGTFPYFCKPHPNMKGTVIVE